MNGDLVMKIGQDSLTSPMALSLTMMIESSSQKVEVLEF